MHSYDAGPMSPLLFGKVPSQADFVRVNVNDPSALALADWVTRATEGLLGAGAQLPPWVSRFIFSAGPGHLAYVGVLAPSRDSVGRGFPVCVAMPIPAARAADAFAALPMAMAPFLDAATALLHEIPLLSIEDTRARLMGMPMPAIGGIATAIGACRKALIDEPVSELCARLFAGNRGALHYALHTFAVATGSVRGKPPERAPIVLDCPIGDDVDLLAWLALAQRSLGWPGALPTAHWSGGVEPRLLLALGPPTAQFFQFVAGKPESSHLWPLVTPRSDAQAAAGEALAAPLAALGDLDAVNLDTLLTVLSAHTIA